ncbi:DUF5655 domain-containing protein [Mycoplasmopsis edwardii]|uniref:DUF5655 domain-containing protein n=1 Tax=Mycoplasmopsis edwardii TaxID=53558 RepID=UPI001C65B985|nr:DUF5655 domain-containing protein [Mycoplasmopsis edwardii]
MYTIDSYDISDKARVLFDNLEEKILKLKDVSRNYTKIYIAYKFKSNFVCIVFRKKGLTIVVDMKVNEINNPQEVPLEDISKVGSWGTGDTKIILNNLKDVDDVMDIIKQSYELQKNK